MSLNDLYGPPKPLRAVPDTTPIVTPEAKNRGQRWAQRKLEEQTTELAAMPPNSGRNAQLNAIAYSCGRLIPGGWLDEQHVRDTLEQAALQSGLGHDETLKTIDSGIQAGTSAPRNPPIREDAAPGASSDPFDTPPAGVDPATGEILQPAAAPETPGELVRRNLPIIDWHALWADQDEEEWIIEPLLPARRLVALYSAPKVGKSLLLLELCVAIVTGRPVLGVTLDRPRNVLYVDFENDPKADIRERLQAMGVGPDDLSRLHYLSFPNLAALDSERGGLEIMAAVHEYACEVVVVDTVSRAIAGEENENDTWLNFYRHTGLRMKQAGIALIRLDHSGKDETKGQRGGSAKSGDVDAVWRLSRITDDSYRLDCEAARLPIHERTLVLHREEGPLRHRVDAEGKSAAGRIQVNRAVQALDKLGVPNSLGRDKARAALRDAGMLKVSNWALAEACKKRQRRDENLSANLADRWSERDDD